MKKQNRSKGFTMAEVLLVVALIAVLSGVAFIAVWNHLRSLTQLEYDGIAKEIFVAAQNHLTMAENQGYLQASKASDYGTADTTEGSGKNVYYFTVNQGDSFGDAGNLVLKLMLPFAAVDETVRAGGSYLIQYQAEPALVMNVFYSAPNGRFGHEFAGSEYSTLLDLADDSKKSDRRNYGGDVIGWYGGEEARNLPIGDPLLEPTVEVINRERLQVIITNPNIEGELKLIIKGMTSEKKKEFVLIDGTGNKNTSYWDGDRFTVTLDDITKSGQHFSELFPDFLPGEDISIQAVAFDNTKLTNIAYSAEKTTNSLYADLEVKEETTIDGTVSVYNTATIAFIRHLENLDERVSSLSEKISVNSAQQITDLSWTDFVAEINGNSTTLDQAVSIWYGTTETDDGCFLPVIPPEGISYDGLLHRISDIKVNIADNAGIFGKTTNGSVSSLLVINSEFTAANGGNAGALIGDMTGTVVQGCAAFATVSGSADAGGLIGFASGGRIDGCYSAGHTESGVYPAAIVSTKPCDVTSIGDSGSAGGLVGSASDTKVDSCYSTCSVNGSTAGGFIGTGNGNVEIGNSYSTGFVTGSNKGAFAGSFTGTLTGNWYYEIINEHPSDDASGKDNSFIYLTAIGGTAGETLPTADQIKALDATASSYNSFCGDPENWNKAEPEDDALKIWYQNKYNLRTISQLVGTNAESAGYDFFDTHYGDWPAPEIFVINQVTDSGSSGNGNGETAGG